MMRIAAILLITTLAISVQAQDYYAYATAESEDEVALVKFDGEKATVEKTIPVGVWPAEIEGPHGINVSLDGKNWFLSLAHGNPYGTLYKFSTETNEVVGKVELGLFPATMAMSPVTGFLYCVNFNLHGDMVPSTVSVVDPETMTELTTIETGTMPHGSRITSDGKFHYSVAMMTGELFEINTLDMKVSRILNLDKNEKVMTASDHAAMGHDMSKMDHSKMDHSKMDHSKMSHSKIKPTWAAPHPEKSLVYVAGNGSDEILEINRDDWKITRRFEGGKAPYNIEVTPNGKYFLVTYKGEGTTGIWDVKKGKETARVANTTSVSHGIAITTDSKYAFVTAEGKGGEPGRVDVIDIKAGKKVSSVGIGKQAGGIIFWKME